MCRVALCGACLDAADILFLPAQKTTADGTLSTPFASQKATATYPLLPFGAKLALNQHPANSATSGLRNRCVLPGKERTQ
jgi:hypothetical protein